MDPHVFVKQFTGANDVVAELVHLANREAWHVSRDHEYGYAFVGPTVFVCLRAGHDEIGYVRAGYHCLLTVDHIEIAVGDGAGGDGGCVGTSVWLRQRKSSP